MRNLTAAVFSLGIVAPLVVLEGPGGVEYALAPVVRDQKSVLTKNTLDEVCWQTTFRKAREAVPVRISYVIHSAGDRRHFVSPYRPDRKTAINASETSRKGDNASFDNCIARPRHLRDLPFELRGRVDYDVAAHDFWTVPRELPVVKVPAP